MAKTVRRVVTAQVEGRGTIASDGKAPAPIEVPGGAVLEIWRASAAGVAAREGSGWRLEPPQGGSVVRIAEFDPAVAGEPFMHLTETVDYGLVLDGEITLVMDDGETVLRPGDIVVQQAANHGWVNRSGAPCRMLFVLIDRR